MKRTNFHLSRVRPLVRYLECIMRVFDAAVSKAYKNKSVFVGREIFAGEHAFKECGEWLPEKRPSDAIKNIK